MPFFSLGELGQFVEGVGCALARDGTGGLLCLLLVFVLIIIIIVFLAFVPFHYHTSHSESLEVTERMDVPVSALSVKLETLVVGLAAVDGDSAEL